MRVIKRDGNVMICSLCISFPYEPVIFYKLTKSCCSDCMELSCFSTEDSSSNISSSTSLSSPLDSLSVELENACKEEAEVKTELQTVRHKLDRQPQSTEKENIHRGPVPKQLKVCANFCSSTVAIGVSF